jgi:hypothetical protein
MKKKSLTVLSIKQLAKTKNAEGVESLERVSFRESKEHFAIYTLKPGETIVKDTAGNIIQVGTIKLNDSIIATLDEVTTQDGTKVSNWYFLTNQDVTAYVLAEANRDVASLVDLEQKRRQASIAKEFANFDLTAAMATA